MFLGMRLFKHLPAISFQPVEVPSRPSGFFLKPVPHIIPSSDGGASLLIFKRRDLVWVCAQAADVVEMFIYLREPCHVCQLLLTISHAADDSIYPSTVDVRTGRTLDGLKLVLEAAAIPACGNGSNLSIPLAGPVSSEDMATTGAGARLHDQDTSNLNHLYDFEEILMPVEKLAVGGAEMVITSNSSRRASVRMEKMKNLGFDPSLFVGAITSGELTHQYIQRRDDDWFAAHGRSCIHMTRNDRGAISLEGLGLRVVESIEEAEFIFGPRHGSIMPAFWFCCPLKIEDLEKVLERFAAKRIPMVVANPYFVTVEARALRVMHWYIK